MPPATPDRLPSPEAMRSVFRVYEVSEAEEGIHYYGDPLVDRERLVESVWPEFRAAGYEVRLERRLGEYVLVATPQGNDDGVPWTNVILAVATVFSTLLVGTQWYYVEDLFSPAILQALPFTLAVMGVLGTHELGHYVLSRYYDVPASLPYFIPFPSIIGTMGAVIKVKGRIPNRRALFDIGVAGPLAGLVATVVVTVIGLSLPPVQVPDWVMAAESTVEIQFNYPLLLQAIAAAMGQPLSYADPRLVVNPVVIGGWVGMFITFLNLIPVGQLDGGHLLRAMVGPAQERIAPLVPLSLFGLAGGLYLLTDAGQMVTVWVIWGFMAMLAAWIGSASPVVDTPLDRRRQLLGVATFVLGLLCFTPIPIEIIGL
ncbi:site-2 protease family protein [Halodesulfurarchaeum sp. HSR-GB]|uniref:site-2 protease family protein n=1 Tax=Halodesulfurarchaeum sp. HSR-GB TaxID=3074077 RepID=UPI00286509A6|nr:site-2 protease family protein [Halodesulfurarchaeum sp. HSR-GB]MDR5656002.1 site-2 protease family protein [Halodesulfurarchaeum sp. HSR-GB]